MIIKFKKSQLKSLFLISLFMIMMAAMAYGITIVLNSPESGSWYTNSSSVDHVFTPYINSSLETIDHCSVWSNRTGATWSLLANYTSGFANATPFKRGIAWFDTGNNTVGWNVSCIFNASEGSPVWADAGVIFNLGVDSNPPTITLDSPDDNTYTKSNNSLLKYTPIDTSNPETCLLYSNESGGWGINQTNASYVSGVQILVNLSANFTSTGLMSNLITNDSQPDGEYIWNVLCNDSANNLVWAEDTNRTFTIDTLFPTDTSFTLPPNGTVSSDSTPYISWNRTTEIHFVEYIIRVSTETINFTSNVFQTLIISDITINETNLSNLPDDVEYFIVVTASDLAGNEKNTTTILTYSVDATPPVPTLIFPANNSYSPNSTVNFTVSVLDNNPDTCQLWLSNSTAGLGSLTINKSDINMKNSTVTNITSSTNLDDGIYKFNIECNDSANNRVNVSSSLLDLTVDTIPPGQPNISSLWHQINSTDGTPVLEWLVSSDTNFDKYVIEARYIGNGSLDFNASVTNISTSLLELNLTIGNPFDNGAHTYNFSVTSYDLAGWINRSPNTTKTWHYVDGVCSKLEIGWNLCGATWTSPKNLSTTGAETSATFVTVWNKTHGWSTCVYNVSVANCNITTGINSSESDNELIGHVWVYVDEETLWENRTWISTQLNANITLTNSSNGWNIIPGMFRNGRVFGNLGRDFKSNNVSMFSLPYVNGSVVSYVNKPPFSTMVVNDTEFDYGQAMWVFYNGTGLFKNTTGNYTFDVGSW